jgi:paired amphipathic helix protein Sin3a
MKKNHYEENLFRFEDQRYEIDIVLENFKFVVDSLENLKQKLENEKIEQLNLEQLTHEIGKNNVTFITRFYQTYSNKIIQSLLSHPKKTIDIILNRFNKRIEEKQNQKEETEKNNKSSFDRFYSKSFDYRSFKFKNFDKKNNNAKAFLKEVLNRKKDKLTTSNSNVLKGGTDNSEFFTTLNLKYQDDDLLKKTKDLSNPILLNNINLDLMRKKLPELKIIFENIDILKLTIGMVYYQIYNTNNIDTGKINEYFNPLFLNLFGFDLTKLTDNLKK